MKKRLLQALITGLVVSSFVITPVMATPQENVERLEESVEKLEEGFKITTSAFSPISTFMLEITLCSFITSTISRVLNAHL